MKGGIGYRRKLRDQYTALSLAEVIRQYGLYVLILSIISNKNSKLKKIK